jgi:phosphoadenosine phosphosulfate reductase
MPREIQLDGTIYDKSAIAIERIRAMAPIADRLFGGFTVMVSGGKDSSVITDLAIRSGEKIKFETSWTGIEYPETVYFLRREQKRLREAGYSFEFIIPRDKDGKQITMWKLIEKAGFPNRHIRFCCKYLKENTGGDSYCILGIRWAESVKRKNSRYIHEQASRNIAKREIMTNNDNLAVRRMTEVCMKKNKYTLNPIIEWSDDEVWQYIREQELPYNSLYDRGHKRVGCIGCPMVNNKKELENNPRWAALYKRSAERYLDKKTAKCGVLHGSLTNIDTYWEWWVNGSMRYEEERELI